uniref:Uncharacterized protein n=1 Tax=Graphocephala atropunctata TaxID=36148 RepID=A0A1B6MEG7_9HEMI
MPQSPAEDSDDDCNMAMASEPDEADQCKENLRKSRTHSFYCNILVTNFRRHVFRNHALEKEVREMWCGNDNDLKLRRKKRHQLFDVFRKKGNYMYNSSTNVPQDRPLLPLSDPHQH